MTALLDPAFLSELEALRKRMLVRARSGGAGEHLAKRRGGAAEFQDHRPYSPGDDLRRIDWAAFARTGEPVLKLFRTEEDVVVRLLLDVSSSLNFGTPNKLDTARRLAAAIGYMALAGSQRAQLITLSDSIQSMSRPVRGRAGLAPLFSALQSLAPQGQTNLTRGLDALLAADFRPGLLVVLSDFFDSGPVLQALSRVRASGHDLALVQVLSPEELEPRWDGDWTLEDAETGAVVDVTMDGPALQAYLQRLGGLCEELRSFARKHASSYVRVRTDEPLESVARRFVARSVD